MIVVSDTSPLSNLFVIGRLDLLQKLYSRIIVPGAVMDELLELEKRGVDLTAIKSASWIEIKLLPSREMVDELLLQVDLGEAEAIILAKSLQADWLLIDETKGRNIAKLQGLHIIGLLGVILQAKNKGYVTNVKDLLNELVSKARFRVSDELREKFLELAGE